VWLCPLTQFIEHVVGVQKCSFNHAIIGLWCSREIRSMHGTMAGHLRQARSGQEKWFGCELLTQGLVGGQKAKQGGGRCRGGLVRCRQAGGRGSTCGRTASYTESLTLASWAAGGHRARGGTAAPPAWPPFTCGRRGNITQTSNASALDEKESGSKVQGRRWTTIKRKGYWFVHLTS
jgi:hypothetical protein